MYRFSYKVNQRRCIRRIKRQSIHKIIVPNSESSDNSYFSESQEDLLETHYQEQQPYEQTSLMSISNEYDSFVTSIDHLDDDFNWISEEEYEDDKRPLCNGSSITVTNAVHRITNFYLNINLDKHKVNGLLRLIKSLLPKPNLLPSTLKSMNKVLQYCSSTSTVLLCSDCYQSCNKLGIRSEMCINPNCSTSFRARRTTEIIEVVRFDIRYQIQSIMNRNTAVMNKSQLFPPSDIVFGDQYQHLLNTNSNKITLVVHSDGAPIVRSSKKSIWPCFASIVEIPPPLREFQSNIIVLAFWLSKKKPDVNIFLQETVNDLSLIIKNGTSIFIGDKEYKIELGTQFFISDLPAKALFCCTTYFNGYSACTFCHSRGKASFFFLFKNIVVCILVFGIQIIIKFSIHTKNNDLTARTHDGYFKAAKEAILKSNGGKEVAIDVSQWKAKNSRLFVLHVGVPIMLNFLPILQYSHFVIYSLAIKLLYAPQTKEEILFAERLMDYYCRTASCVHDESIEIFSLHAHLHLEYQARLHGGLVHMSAFAFESLIRYIKRKAHGSFKLSSQIAY
ncbi:unnamed protein product [Rotaria sp. Silwood2]|nr:unnamed protein product [Rotaria sp. Silwood2]CAF4240924.1 unnamed protein product [Rotaria sp. Silwood2]